MHKTYIYTLSHPLTKEIKYVGKTINIEDRLKNHIHLRNKTYCSNWIFSLKKQNLLPVLEIIDETEDNWQELEQYWIAQFRAWGFNLTNLTDGGEGRVGIKVSEESIKKQKESVALFWSTHSHPSKGKKLIRKKFREPPYYSTLNEEQVLKIRELLIEKRPIKEIADMFNVTTHPIQQIKKGKTWKHLGEFNCEGRAKKVYKEFEENKIKIIELLKNNISVLEISKMFNHALSSIYKIKREML